MRRTINRDRQEQINEAAGINNDIRITDLGPVHERGSDWMIMHRFNVSPTRTPQYRDPQLQLNYWVDNLLNPNVELVNQSTQANAQSTEPTVTDQVIQESHKRKREDDDQSPRNSYQRI